MLPFLRPSPFPSPPHRPPLLLLLFLYVSCLQVPCFLGPPIILCRPPVLEVASVIGGCGGGAGGVYGSVGVGSGCGNGSRAAIG